MFFVFGALFFFAAGSAADQTVPAVHDFTAEYIVGAEHSDDKPYEQRTSR